MKTLLLVASLLAQGQGEVAAPAPPQAVAGAKSELSQNDRAYVLGKQLRCPVCQGMSIAESPSAMAQDMMKRVRTLVDEGKSDEEVYASFINSYGEWVLLAPPAKGFSLWVWILPPLFVLGAAAMLVRWVRKLRGGKEPSPAERAPQAPANTQDAFLQAIRDEVQR